MQDPKISHKVGTTAGDGWAVSEQDPAGYMQYGPYVTSLLVGDQVATWKLKVDKKSVGMDKIVRLEVSDADDGGKIINQRDVLRSEWKKANHYEYFSVPFTLDKSRQGHRIELRVWSYGGASVKQQLVGIS